jgi:MFS family permease
MIWAKLSDIAGRKYTLIAALLIFTLFSALCGASQTLIQLIMFRWCQGIGGCGVYALTQLMFMEIVPQRKLPQYMAGVSMVLALSLITGPLLGGGITLHGSWRWIFLLKYVCHPRIVSICTNIKPAFLWGFLLPSHYASRFRGRCSTNQLHSRHTPSSRSILSVDSTS